ncbi:MFS transporter [Gleimia sp. 6138-11-ORH1]|uniref:MFS transporter n=1 Tax=Gleimia sp. 6138-11-ORH1 TaxID=2973937 RepID=UPI002167DF46|nr:MFS transporter [Gleimia sp. 6138-11-ORH1]MCS4484994.1 MFS transporter [Gleimia sp. 6138-11-ORH1]
MESISRKKKRILSTLLVPLAMSLIAVSSVNIALSSIATGIHASDAQLQWILSGYPLVVGMTLVPAGRLGDIFSRRKIFILGLIAFVTGSLLSGLAPTAFFLNIARVIQGMGAGMYSPQIIGMIQQHFQGRERALAFGLFGMVVSFSVALGPVVAGALISGIGVENGWRYIFFINLPLGVLGIALGYFWLPKENGGEPVSEAAASLWGLDYFGAVLLLSGIVLTLIPFTFRTFSWWLPLMLVAAAAVFVLWLKWEKYLPTVGKEPMVDLSLLRIRSFLVGTVTAASYFMGAPTMFVVLAIFVQNELGHSALVAGTLGLPNALLSAVGSRWGALKVSQWGKAISLVALFTVIAGVLFVIVVMAGIIFFEQSVWWLLLALALMGFGQGVFGSTNQTLSMEDVPLSSGGTAGGFKQTTERIGTSIGSALLTGLYFTVSAIWSPGVAVLLVFAATAGFVSFAALLAYLDFSRGRSARP